MTKTKKSRLGKGLGALLGDVPSPMGTELSGRTSAGLLDIPIEDLQRGHYQPRRHMDGEALEELADSIRSQGILQPLLVRRLPEGGHEIIAGERRWRAAQRAGLSRVPAVVRDIDDETAMAMALIENIQRQDLNAIEEAMGFRRLLDEFGLTHEEVATSVGRSRAAITNVLRLLNLHPDVQQRVQAGEVEMGHARALLGLPPERQPEGAHKVIQGKLSVRATEHMVKRMNRLRRTPDRQSGDSDQDIRRLEDELSGRIQARVEIHHHPKNSRLVIYYHSLDELDGILKRIR